MRIARLLGVNPPPVFPRAAAIVLLALAGTGGALAAMGSAGAQSASAAKELSGGEGSSLYQEWLDQDARWIITPEEKQAFLRLRTDQEREAFIRQFWDRRNPDPSSLANAYRHEHYRRIAYANMHFAINGKSGWETDRGHVYIVFGPPDSIDSHPSGGNDSTMPFEVWHYRSIMIEVAGLKNQNGAGYSASSEIRKEVDFRFADDCDCGRYQLRSSWPSATPAQNNAPADSGGKRPVAGVQTVTSTSKAARPDLSCTYYDAHTTGFEGTCETRQGHEGHYYCVDNDNNHRYEEQAGCEWKIDRARSLEQRVPEIRLQ